LGKVKTEFKGEKVTIRKTTKKDLPALMALWNDGRVMKWVGYPQGLDMDMVKMEDWFHHWQNKPHRHHFTVHDQLIGFCGEVYYEVDNIHRRAALDIKFIPTAQGKGLAIDAFKTLPRLVFESETEVEVVWTEPIEENIASRKLYTRCGLKPKSRPID
jgi:RimJ/RimL family protein N-acetyltransferase